MNEKQRMQYTEAMGIDCFVPRALLPLAPLPKQCQLPASVVELGANDHAAVGVAPVGSELVADNAGAPALLDQLSSSSTGAVEDVGEGANAPAPVSESGYNGGAGNGNTGEGDAVEVKGGEGHPGESHVADVTSHEVSVAFSLSLWRVEQKLLVIDSRRVGEALPCDKLLYNMLRAAGLLAKQSLPRAEVLSWPLPGAAMQDQSLPAAREMVAAFLEGRLVAQPVTHILLLGEDGARVLLDSEHDFGELCYQPRGLAAYNAQALILPSLAQLLYAPAAKATVWQVLAPFAKSLLA